MTASDLSPTELEILSRAFKRSEGIAIWSLVGRLGIPVRNVATAFRTLQRLGFLIEENDLLRITSKGRGWVMQNQSIFAFSGEKKWRLVPDSFESDSIKAFEPYAPRIRRLDKRTFPVGD